jgi:archaellum component FlaC
MVAVATIADLSDESFAELEERNLRMEADLASIKKILIGNGDPTNSLVARLTRIEEDSNKFSSTLQEIRTYLVGDLTTKKDSICDKIDSIEDRLVKVESSMSSINKVVWIAITAVIGEIVLTILRLF